MQAQAKYVERTGRQNNLKAAVGMSLWPTPTVCGNNNRKGLSEKSGDGLATAVKRLTYPTPSATDGKRGGVMTENMTGQSLTQVVNTLVRFPTPCATDHKGAGKSGKLRDRLDYAAERGATKSNTYATPQARDFRSGQTSRWDDPNRSRNLNDKIGGQLNPNWVEWLMHWPVGWTSLEPMSMDDFLKHETWDVEPEIGRVAVGVPARVDRLKAIGNGQVRLCAATAFKLLHERIAA